MQCNPQKRTNKVEAKVEPGIVNKTSNTNMDMYHSHRPAVERQLKRDDDAASTQSPMTMKMKREQRKLLTERIMSLEECLTGLAEESSSEDGARKEHDHADDPQADAKNMDGSDYVENWTFRRPSIEMNIQGNKMPWIAMQLDGDMESCSKPHASRNEEGREGEARAAVAGAEASRGTGDGPAGGSESLRPGRAPTLPPPSSAAPLSASERESEPLEPEELDLPPEGAAGEPTKEPYVRRSSDLSYHGPFADDIMIMEDGEEDLFGGDE